MIEIKKILEKSVKLRNLQSPSSYINHFLLSRNQTSFHFLLNNSILYKCNNTKLSCKCIKLLCLSPVYRFHYSRLAITYVSNLFNSPYGHFQFQDGDERLPVIPFSEPPTDILHICAHQTEHFSVTLSICEVRSAYSYFIVLPEQHRNIKRTVVGETSSSCLTSRSLLVLDNHSLIDISRAVLNRSVEAIRIDRRSVDRSPSRWIIDRGTGEAIAIAPVRDFSHLGARAGTTTE